MPNEQLVTYIRGELAKGVDRETVIKALLTSGWRVEDINVAMGSIAPIVSTPNLPPVYQAPAAPFQSAYSIPPASSQNISLKTTIQNMAAGFFIFCVTVLTGISVLGVWDVFSGDVITKSFETLGLLAFASVVVIIASRFVGDPSAEVIPPAPNPIYRAIRNITVATLITSASFLALLGVLAIWNVINDSSTVNKSLSSLGIIAFSSFIIVMVCLEREQTPRIKRGK